VSLVHP